MTSQRREQVKRENKVFALIVAAGMIILAAKLHFLWFLALVKRRTRMTNNNVFQ